MLALMTVNNTNYTVGCSDFMINLEELYVASAPVQFPSCCYETVRSAHQQPMPYERYLTTLAKYGVLIISLAYADDGNTFRTIIEQIGFFHTHNEKDSILWDIKVADKKKCDPYLGRSHTASEFYLHTDCSYEVNIPDHFGLYVVQADRLDGGNNLIVDSKELIPLLSTASLQILQKYPVSIKVPQEFYKGIEAITAPIIDHNFNIRYRREIIEEEKLTILQKSALHEFETLIYSKLLARRLTLHNNQILLLNNKCYLHARTAIKDEKRHLQRIRFFLK
jgi:alpha-ketoglutarate-dependent taurine dioxygenase